MKKKTFDKKDITPNYSLNVFTIKKIKGNKYLLSNDRLYNPSDLQKVNADSKELLFDNIEKNNTVNKKVRKQKQEKAFSDPKTHFVDSEGNVLITRRHLKPLNEKRVRRAPQRLLL